MSEEVKIKSEVTAAKEIKTLVEMLSDKEKAETAKRIAMCEAAYQCGYVDGFRSRSQPNAT